MKFNPITLLNGGKGGGMAIGKLAQPLEAGTDLNEISAAGVYVCNDNAIHHKVHLNENSTPSVYVDKNNTIHHKDAFEIKEQCKKCFHFQVCANIMKNQLFIREKMLKEENPKCEHFAPAEDVEKVVRCKDCEYLTVHNSPTLYAYCEKTHLRFEPFKTDTRTHYCGYSKKKEG